MTWGCFEAIFVTISKNKFQTELKYFLPFFIKNFKSFKEKSGSPKVNLRHLLYDLI